MTHAETGKHPVRSGLGVRAAYQADEITYAWRIASASTSSW